MFEIRNNDGPECPHCGYIEDPCEGGFYDQSVDQIQCESCDELYNVSTRVVWTWISKK